MLEIFSEGVVIESRKLIAFGKNSFVISIPKDWVKQNKLKKGDKVYIDDEPAELKVTPKNEQTSPEKSSTTIDISSKTEPMIETEIVSAYLTNHHIIEITGQDIKNKLSFIKKIALNLAGMELMEQTSSKMVFKDYLNVWEVSIANIVRRIDITIRSMLEDCHKANKKDDYESIVERDQDVNRLAFMAFKVIRDANMNPALKKHYNLNHLDLLNTWDIITRLEKIGDQTKRIARHMIKSRLKKKAKKEIKDLYLNIIQSYLRTIKSYYTKDKKAAHEVVQEVKGHVRSCNRFLESHHETSTIYVIENLKSMSSSCKHVAYAVISMT